MTIDQEKASERVKAVVQNPHLTDLFFLHHAENFFFENCLDVKDYWVRIEYRHRESAHIHSVACMDRFPDEGGISENWVRVQHPTDDKPIDPRDSADADHEAQEVYDFADALVSTWNPAMDENGIGELPQTQAHLCHRHYRDVEDEDRDYAELIAVMSHCLLSSSPKE